MKRGTGWIVLEFAIGVIAGLSVGFAVSALAARNSSGSYALPAGNPVVTGTKITSSWANSTLSDIGAELTDSLSRSGKGGMLAPVREISGTASAPAYSWSSDTNSGLYRVSAGTVGMTANGVLAQSWTSAGATIPGTLAVTGNETIGGTCSVTGTSTFAGVTAGAVSASSLTVSGATSVSSLLASSSIAATGAMSTSSTFTAYNGIVVSNTAGSDAISITGKQRGAVITRGTGVAIHLTSSGTPSGLVDGDLWTEDSGGKVYFKIHANGTDYFLSVTTSTPY